MIACTAVAVPDVASTGASRPGIDEVISLSQASEESQPTVPSKLCGK